MLFQNLYVPLSINGAFRDVQVTNDAMGLNTAHTITDAGVDLSFENNLDALFLL